MLVRLIGFLLIGRLTIFFLQKFPFQKVPIIGRYFQDGGFLQELFSCDLCLGVYLFAALGYILHLDFIRDIFGTYLVVFNEVMTGMIASFVVHIFRIGWESKFGMIVME